MYHACMAVALQIREVPEEVRDAISEQAAQQGKSMQAYLLDMVRREARRVRNPELFDRTARHRRIIPDELDPDRIITVDRSTTA